MLSAGSVPRIFLELGTARSMLLLSDAPEISPRWIKLTSAPLCGQTTRKIFSEGPCKQTTRSKPPAYKRKLSTSAGWHRQVCPPALEKAE